MRKADLCAGCHQYTNRQGVPVMDTFTDWQAVGTPEATLPCQGCHMKDVFELVTDEEPMEWLVDDPMIRQMSAQRRDPNDVSRHEMWGGVQYAPHALDLTMTARLTGDDLLVRTSIVNVGANHRVPTGMPFREVILLVSAVAEDGATPLALIDGPRVGSRGGDYASEPGKMFAKTLGDANGNMTFAFWDATELIEDTRLATGQTDSSEFHFRLPAAGGSVQVSARLVYHRFSQVLAQAKGWDMGELEMKRADKTVDLGAPPDGGPGADAGADEGGDAGPQGDFQQGCTCRTMPASPTGGRMAALASLPLLAILVLSHRRR